MCYYIKKALTILLHYATSYLRQLNAKKMEIPQCILKKNESLPIKYTPKHLRNR